MYISLVGKLLLILAGIVGIFFTGLIFYKIFEISSMIINIIVEKSFSYFGYYTTVIMNIKETKYLWRQTYRKCFHFNFLNSILCNDGRVRFGTYFVIYRNGYFSHYSIKYPEI